MKKNIAIFPFLAILLTLSSCGGPVAMPQPTSNTEPTVTEAATTETAVTETATTQPATEPPAPTPYLEPYFEPVVRFSAGPRYPETREFETGTKQIFAIWNYTNMKPGLIVRREWHLNDQLWLVREEPWDFEKYGENGTISDISIYDFDAGLPSGKYELLLYINNLPQFLPDPNVRESAFSIQDSPANPTRLLSPNGEFEATIENRQSTIVVRNQKGEVLQLFNALKISQMTWFPDNTHLIFTNSDDSEQVGTSTIGIERELLLANIQTGTLRPLVEVDFPLQHAIISPDGHYVAALLGNGYFDACMSGYELVFFELNGKLEVARTYRTAAFANLPTDLDYYPTFKKGEHFGEWTSPTQFNSALQWFCVLDGNNYDGVYTFDLQTLSADYNGTQP